MWVADYYTAAETARTFTMKVNVKATDQNITSGANAPELVGDMIPVVYDGTNWVKASSDNWYDYNNQKWANAVTTTSTNRATYTSASAGTTISMDDINTMFVWIPRYSYTIGNTYGVQGYGGSTPSATTPGAIDIKFVTKSTTETGTGQYTGSTASNYYTPASFCFGDTCDTSRSDSTNKEVNGIWVSKFEVTGTISSITSIPNVTSLRNQTVSAFYNGINTQMNGTNGSSIYGFSGSYDAHMMKNIEWGAMAYLSQSKYGKYGNTSYTEANKEIYQNKSSGYITGNSNGTPSTTTTNTQVAYNVSGTGTGASTTGNIYGIYDTSGGAYEYVMGNYNGTISSSGFSSLPSLKNYNKYTGSIGFKGDATNADGTNGWYGDYAYFVSSGTPWFMRGGYYSRSSDSGPFYFSYNSGNADSSNGVRVCLES